MEPNLRIYARDETANDPFDGIACRDLAVDTLTGFTGIVTGRCDYISGCNQVLLQPLAKDGDFKESRWFDVERVEVIEAGKAQVASRPTGAETPPPSRNATK